MSDGVTAARGAERRDGDSVLLVVRGLTKRYPGVLALDHVDIDVSSHEVHCLVGDVDEVGGGGHRSGKLSHLRSCPVKQIDGLTLLDLVEQLPLAVFDPIK